MSSDLATLYAAGMAHTQGWQFETCKLHKKWECAWSTQENFRFLLWSCYMYSKIAKEKEQTGLCKPLWSIRLKCPLMTKLETKHIMQAKVCDCISTEN